MKNETLLIKDAGKRIMTARGYKLLYRFIDKAAEANGFSHHRAPAFKEKKERLYSLVEILVFEKGVSEKQLAGFISSIKVSKTQPLGISFDKLFIVA